MVADQQTPTAAAPEQFNSPPPIMYDRTAAADDQARTGRHLEVVQRIRFRDVFAVRRDDDEHLSSFGSATDTA